MTWDSLMAYCVAVVGISPRDFWRSTFGQVSGYIRSFNDAEELKQRGEWERVRWHIAAISGMLSGKGTKPTDVAKFPWDAKEDEKPPVRVLTKEEQFRLFGRDDRRMREMAEKKAQNGS